MRNYKSSFALCLRMEELSFDEKLLELRKLKGISKGAKLLTRAQLRKIIEREFNSC